MTESTYLCFEVNREIGAKPISPGVIQRCQHRRPKGRSVREEL